MPDFGIIKSRSQKIRQIKHITETLFLSFPSSYLVEAGFSYVNRLLRKTRNITEHSNFQ